MGYREGFSVFDFGRTHYLHRGLIEFKSRWGTRMADLPQFSPSLASSLSDISLL
jgi:hypothetical protein